MLNGVHVRRPTARNHTHRVIEKVGVHSKLEAMVIAAREKLIEVS